MNSDFACIGSKEGLHADPVQAFSSGDRALNYVTKNTEVLDALGIDLFCAEVIEGKTFTKIAQELGVPKATLLNWLAADPDRSARASESRRLSAQTYDDMALDALTDKRLDPARAREIAQHLRWRASKIAPKDYGDKLQIDSTTTVLNLSEAEILKRRDAIQRKLEESMRPLPPIDDVEPRQIEGGTP